MEPISAAEIRKDTSSIVPFAMSVEGLEGVGKTHFGLLTCPTPIVHVNFTDRSARSFAYQMSEERAEKVSFYEFKAQGMHGWTRQEGRESLEQLSKIAMERMGKGALEGGTFILDSGTSWWNVVTDVHVAPLQEQREMEGKKQRGGIEYGPGNLIVSGVINWLKNQGAFIVLTHRKAAVWDANGPVPGQYRAQLNSKVPYLVEVRLDLRKRCLKCNSEECQALGHVGRKHVGRLLKFAANTALEGQELEEPTFSNIYTLYAGRKFPNGEALR